MTKSQAALFSKVIFRRFIKSFLAGGFAGLTIMLSQNPNPAISNLVELKTWGITLGYAFLVGGIMALEKASQGYNPR
jgi:hypothetical protein